MFYKILLLILRLTVLTAGAVVVMVLSQLHIYVAAGIVVIAAFLLCKRTVHLSAHGTARWANASDLKGMIE